MYVHTTTFAIPIGELLATIMCLWFFPRFQERVAKKLSKRMCEREREFVGEGNIMGDGMRWYRE